jgi:phosphoserine phosphatase RsbU/P
VVVADVAGSDVEAAEYTTMGKHVLRTYAREYSSPSEILMKTNDLICEDLRSEMFISLFYGILDLEQMKLKYTHAGCEQPLLYKASDKSIRALTAEGMLLGIRRGTTYEECEVDIEPGDVLAIFTDGLPEAVYDRKRFGTQAVMDVVSANAHLDAQQIVDNLHDTLLEYVHGRITDDVAMVVVKVL